MRKIKLIAAAVSAAVLLTSCAMPWEKKNDTPKGSSMAENKSEKVKQAKEEKKVPEKLDIEAIPISTDTAAGYPDDGSFPYVVGDTPGFTDEYGIYHFSCDELYHEFCEASMGYRESLELNGVFEDADFQKATRLLFDMNPDIFWVENIYYQISPEGISTFELRKTEGTDMAKVPQMHEELMTKADEIAALAYEKGTDYEKIKFVHDYIIDNTVYDGTAVNTHRNYAYGCLIEGRTACNGYSKAFELIMQKLGYACGICYGLANGEHVWNYLWFGDDYYWVDITWDDPAIKEHEMRNYSFFLCTDKMFLNEHSIHDYNLFVPICDHDTYSYIDMNELKMEKYDFDRVDSLCYACTDDHIDLCFSSYDEYLKALNELYDKKMIHSTYISGPDTQFYFSWTDMNKCISIDWWE